jgi:microcompartment protein CcmK/EutM
MFLAKVEGSVVATKKDPSMSGRKLLLLRPQLVDEKDPTKFRPGVNTIVAVDASARAKAKWFCSARAVPRGSRRA